MTPRLLLLALAAVGPPVGHPMHTSVADVRYDRALGLARIEIRVYADDLSQAVPHAPAAGDSALARYGRSRFTMARPDGRPLALAWRGAERAGDAVVLRFAAQHAGGLRGARIGSAILHEQFRDQVNVVRVTEGARTTTLLFLRGDQPKIVP